jgi:hypothetical protein
MKSAIDNVNSGCISGFFSFPDTNTAIMIDTVPPILKSEPIILITVIGVPKDKVSLKKLALHSIMSW